MVVFTFHIEEPDRSDKDLTFLYEIKWAQKRLKKKIIFYVRR